MSQTARIFAGHCVGAGIDLATACDIRCCTPGAQFCVKEIDLGITADLGTLQRLFRLVGEGDTDKLLASICVATDGAQLR